MRRVGLGVLVGVLAVAVPAGANHIPVETLLQRMWTDPAPAAFDATANFEGTFMFVWRGGRLTSKIKGSYREWRAAHGQPRRRQVTITEVDAPLILRPLVPGLKRLIGERIEQEEGALSLLEEYDVFITEEQANGRILLGAVRTDIVRDIIKRYARNQDDLKDPNIRRAVARWLFLPGQREMIVRGGGPYAVTLVVDEQGTYYNMLLLYDWGPVGTELEWAQVGGRSIWRNVKMDAVMNAERFGRIEGRLDLTFSNHCFNCSR